MTTDFDAIIVGGGHNGLVAAGYLSRAGFKTAVLESRAILGGPAGNVEFLPGYTASFANSPGSFERRIMVELELEKHGLRFLRPDPSLVHAFPGGNFIGWRDRSQVAEQLDHFSSGESQRYFELLQELERLGCELGVSLFEPSPTLEQLDSRMATSDLFDLYNRVVHGSLEDLLDESLRSQQAKALLAMIALNGNLMSPSDSGSAIGLMMRPISMASGSMDAITASALRGSSGLPVGGMGAIIDALESSAKAHGTQIFTHSEVARILHDGDRVSGVETTEGTLFNASTVISTVSPTLTFGSFLANSSAVSAISNAVIANRPTGSAFKIVLALDGKPSYAGLPDGLSARDVNSAQFRVAPSFDYVKKCIGDGLSGRVTDAPIMWGLLTTMTAPDLAPPGRHLLSINAWHAPYDLVAGEWDTATIEKFGETCLDRIEDLMPDLREHIVGHRYLSPIEIEMELGLPGSNITHGNMTAQSLFGNRPHRAVHDYRTPLRGLYISGAGSWPGGYLTGVPGFGASRAVIRDVRAIHLTGLV